MNRVVRMSMKTVSGALALFSALATVGDAMGDPLPEKLTQAPELRDSIQVAAKKSPVQDKNLMKVRRRRGPASVGELPAGPLVLKANSGPDAGMESTTPAKRVYRTSK